MAFFKSHSLPIPGDSTFGVVVSYLCPVGPVKTTYVVSKIIGPWWCMRGHADGRYNYAPLLASLEGNGDDDDGDYDYAPAA
ncbi:hypothetical protein R6Q59_013278 [Mikania micrantha]